MALEQLPPSENGEYCCCSALDLYDAPDGKALATQAAVGRHLQVISSLPIQNAVQVRLCEDGYEAWLPSDRLTQLKPATTPYRAIALSRAEIESRLAAVIAFAQAAMQQPNYYLWGGTVGPNYDCSGLIQAAFAASGIWLPRDSYQQEAFTDKVAAADLLPGDLIFFGSEKVNHVALHLEDGYYIHSSGTEMGRNGIGIDRLSAQADTIGRAYFQKFWSCGRVSASYQPQ
jgi:cell wall-associated NlpC family hydrolase